MEKYIRQTVGAGCCCGGVVTLVIFFIAMAQCFGASGSLSALPRNLRIVSEGGLVTEKPDAPALNLGVGVYSVTNSEGISDQAEIPNVRMHEVLFDVYGMVHNVTWQSSEMWYQVSDHLRLVYNSDMSNAPVTQPIVTPDTFFGLDLGHSAEERLGYFKASLSEPKTIDSNFLAVTGMLGIFGTCVADRDLDAELAACPQISLAGMYGGHLTRWTYYSGEDDVGKWNAHKEFASTLQPSGKLYFTAWEDAQMPSLPFPVGLEVGDSNTFPVIDNDEFVWYEKELFRNEFLVKLGEEEYLGYPIYRFAPSESMMSVNPKYFVYRAGWFNASFLGLAWTRISWSHRCGWQSSSRQSQVSSFVQGHVTGYPACDWEKDGRYFDYDAFTGLPMFHGEWGREFAFEVPGMGPWTDDNGVAMLYYPWVKVYIPPPLVSPWLADYLMGYWYIAVPTMLGGGFIFFIFVITSIVVCYCGCGLMAAP